MVDPLYEQEKANVVEKVKSLCGTLAIDGWSTRDNQPVLGVSMYVSGLREHNVRRPPRACETRWNSYADKFEYFVKHWSIMGEIINSKLKPTHVEYRYMEQIQLKRSATEAMEFLKPLAIALDQFQSNACTLSQTIDIWATVKNSAPDHFMQQLSQRRKIAS